MALNKVYKETTIRSLKARFLLKASVKRRSEPLNDRCFDFTDEFKLSDLSHFTLQTSIQPKKSETKRQIVVRLFSSQS